MTDSTQDAAETAVPQHIGKYEVRGAVGQGAMGVVYRGYDADIDRLVAIKVLHPHLRDAGLMLRFKHEARAAARCVHRNIVAVFDFGLCDDAPYIVMEYVEGIDLRTFLYTNSALSVRQSCDIVLQVLHALEFAHQNGVVHRDIKPANILLLDNGLVKVADFGVAKIEASELTSVGDLIGTPTYMSPEARVGVSVDCRADLYTVGIVLLELICGKRLEQPMPSSDQTAKVLAEAGLGRAECDAFTRLFGKALGVMPDNRFQTAQEFAAELENTLAPDCVYEPDTANLAATILLTRTLVRQAIVQGPGLARESPLASRLLLTAEASTQLSQILSSFLGPVSNYLIKSALERCQDFDQLIEHLSAKIPSAAERRQFLLRLQKDGLCTAGLLGGESSPSHAEGPSRSGASRPSSKPGQAADFAPEQLEKVTKDLVIYLGPVAPRLVKRTAKHACDLRQLYEMVSEHIHNSQDRERFLRNR